MLHYNVSSRKANVGKHKGKTVYFAQPVPTTRLTARAVEDHLVEKTTLTRGDVRHAITSLAELVRWAFAEGIAIDLADLGSFKVEARSKMVEHEDDVHAGVIKKPVIRFYPRKEMRKYAASVSISVRKSNGSISTNKPELSGDSAGHSAGGEGHSL